MNWAVEKLVNGRWVEVMRFRTEMDARWAVSDWAALGVPLRVVDVRGREV